MSELPRSAFRFDPELVRAFVQDRLDDAGRATLADEVARMLPFHLQLPHPVIADLVAVTGHLGGDEALLRWLDGYAGRPRVTARLFQVINLLDRWSAIPGVVQALEQRRARDPYPHALAGYLIPDTNAGTLASLGQLIESRLADDRLDEAGCLALRSLALLADIAPAAAELDRRAAELKHQVRALRDLVAPWRSAAPITPAADTRRPRADHRRGAVRCARRGQPSGIARSSRNCSASQTTAGPFGSTPGMRSSVSYASATHRTISSRSFSRRRAEQATHLRLHPASSPPTRIGPRAANCGNGLGPSGGSGAAPHRRARPAPRSRRCHPQLPLPG